MATTFPYEDLLRQFYIPFNTGDVDISTAIFSEDRVDDPLSPGQ